MKNILLTGGRGYIGSHILKYLAENTNYSIFQLVRAKENYTKVNQITICELDKLDFQIIINCIGETKQERNMLQANVVTGIQFLKKINLNKVEKFYHFSTIAVYNHAIAGPLSVNSPLSLNNQYSITKWVYDEILLSHADIQTKVTIIRPGNVVLSEKPILSFLKVLEVLRIRIISDSFSKDKFVNWSSISHIINFLESDLRNYGNEKIILLGKSMPTDNFLDYNLSKKWYLNISASTFVKMITFSRIERLKTWCSHFFSPYNFE